MQNLRDRWKIFIDPASTFANPPRTTCRNNDTRLALRLELRKGTNWYPVKGSAELINGMVKTRSTNELRTNLEVRNVRTDRTVQAPPKFWISWTLLNLRILYLNCYEIAHDTRIPNFEYLRLEIWNLKAFGLQIGDSSSGKDKKGTFHKWDTILIIGSMSRLRVQFSGDTILATTNDNY